MVTLFLKEKRFYNEKEWRYFPDESDFEIVKYKDESELVDKRSELNEKPNSSFFKIEPEWIEYILVKSAEDLTELKEALTKSPYCGKYENLLTKVITTNQVLKDF